MPLPGGLPICDTVHTHGNFIVVPFSDDMAQYPTQSHYSDSELTSPYYLLLMLSSRVGSDKYQFSTREISMADNGSSPFHSLPYRNNAKRQAKSRHMRQIYVFKSSVWLNMGVWIQTRDTNRKTCHMRSRRSTHFGHLVWSPWYSEIRRREMLQDV